MSMSKKDYVLIADSISESRQVLVAACEGSTRDQALVQGSIINMVDNLATKFGGDNPSFKAEVFKERCLR